MASSKPLKVNGFLIAADAIVPCGFCGAVEGEPCREVGKKDLGRLKPGFVHIGRRVKRLMLTARDVSKRDALEERAVSELKEWLREHPLPKKRAKAKR